MAFYLLDNGPSPIQVRHANARSECPIIQHEVLFWPEQVLNIRFRCSCYLANGHQPRCLEKPFLDHVVNTLHPFRTRIHQSRDRKVSPKQRHKRRNVLSATDRYDSEPIIKPCPASLFEIFTQGIEIDKVR